VSRVLLRDIRPEDLDVLFEHQRDPVSVRMAGIPARDREAFDAHWEKILADPTVVARAIVCDDVTVGGASSFLVEDGRRVVGYWLGREHWGRGIAGAALARLVEVVAERPLYAEIAADNQGSQRVALRNGFVASGERDAPPKVPGASARLLIFALHDPPWLTGDGLTLRAWQPGDAPALEPACGDPDICRFTTVPASYSPEAADVWVRRQRQRAQDGTAWVWAIVPDDAAQPVGTVGLFGLDAGDRTARLGYWLIRAARGRGIAAAAVRLVARWAATRPLDALFIDVEPGNEASRGVARAVGAAPSGPVRRADIDLERHIVSLRLDTPSTPPEDAADADL
jgi:RimJ/RimL family protein N-acetyltransferase